MKLSKGQMILHFFPITIIWVRNYERAWQGGSFLIYVISGASGTEGSTFKLTSSPICLVLSLLDLSLSLAFSLSPHGVSSSMRTFHCALGFSEWWVPSTQISYIASHSFRRTRWKMLAHLWSRPGIMSLPSYSFGENSHRKAQIQGEGILNTSRSQIQKTTYCLIPFIYCYGKRKIIGMENRLIDMRG